ncbi:MAG: replication-relaxation family protein [Thiogranum sp.]|nr:replication-relaxation family protein [Thiogranum sp.]
MAPEDKRTDGYQVHLENRWAALLWINKFGGLTTRELARLIWTDQTSGMRSAQRTVASLLSDKFLIKRHLDSGGTIYVLSVAGARALQSEGAENVSARGHRDLSFHKPLHRLIANDFLIEKFLEGCKVWTEFEVQRRVAPVPRIVIKTPKESANKKKRKSKEPINHLPKIPDSVIEHNGELIWIEVENSFKSQTRIDEIVLVAGTLLGQSSGYFVKSSRGQGHYKRMYFVASDPERLYAIFRCFLRHYEQETINFDILRRIELIHVSMSSGYVWGGILCALTSSTPIGRATTRTERKGAIKSIFKDGELSLSTLNKAELWQVYIQVVEALNTPLGELTQMFEMDISEYSDLALIPAPIFSKVDMESLLTYLESVRDEWMNKDTTFRKEDFFRLLETSVE